LGKGLSKVFALFLFLMHQVLSSLVRFLQELTKDESGFSKIFGGKGLSKVVRVWPERQTERDLPW
jgi:hypothetical protein